MKNPWPLLTSVMYCAGFLGACSDDALTQTPVVEDQKILRTTFVCGEHGMINRVGVDNGCYPLGLYTAGCDVIYVSSPGQNAVLAYKTSDGSPLARHQVGVSPRRTAVDSQCNGYSTGAGAHKLLYDCTPSVGPNTLSSECVAWSTTFGVDPTLGRDADTNAIAIDANDNVWVGRQIRDPITAQNSGMAYKLDNATGEILSEVEIDPPYGMAVDSEGFIWSLSLIPGNFTRINTQTHEVDRVIEVPGFGLYGFAIAKDDTIAFAQGGCIGLLKPDPAPGTRSGPFCPPGGNTDWVRGVATRTMPDGSQQYFGAGYNNNQVYQYAADGTFLSQLPGGDEGTMAVAFDGEGHLWTINQSNNVMAEHVEAEEGQWSLANTVGLGAQPYNYSDMTGHQLSQFNEDPGTWNMELTAQPGHRFTELVWDADVPAGSVFEFQVFSAEKKGDPLVEYLSSTQNPYAFLSPAEHRFVRVAVTMKSSFDQASLEVRRPKVRTIAVHQEPVE